jgi:hypothetical protein
MLRHHDIVRHRDVQIDTVSDWAQDAPGRVVTPPESPRDLPI